MPWRRQQHSAEAAQQEDDTCQYGYEEYATDKGVEGDFFAFIS